MNPTPPRVRTDLLRGIARLAPGPANGLEWDAAVHAAAATDGVAVLVLAPVGALDADTTDALVAAVLRAPQPVVAVVDGALEGPAAAVALAADLRVWSRDGSVLVRPWDGGAVSWTLPRLVGHGRAADLLMRPRVVPADEAAGLGLATVVADDVDAAAHAVATDLLAAGDPRSSAAVKRALAHASTHDAVSTLDHEAQRRAMLARLRPQA